MRGTMEYTAGLSVSYGFGLVIGGLVVWFLMKLKDDANGKK